MAKLGCLLLVVSIVLIMVGMFAILGTDSAIPILEPLFCPENDTLVRTTRPDYTDGGEFINYYCIDDDGGASTNVDGKLFIAIAALWCPLPVGIMLLIVGAGRSAKRTLQENMRRYGVPIQSGGVTVTTYSTQGDDLSEFNDMLGPLMERAIQLDQRSRAILTDKLRQLQQAYDAKLITFAEYVRSKQQILDDLTGD